MLNLKAKLTLDKNTSKKLRLVLISVIAAFVIRNFIIITTGLNISILYNFILCGLITFICVKLLNNKLANSNTFYSFDIYVFIMVLINLILVFFFKKYIAENVVAVFFYSSVYMPNIIKLSVASEGAIISRPPTPQTPPVVISTTPVPTPPPPPPPRSMPFFESRAGRHITEWPGRHIEDLSPPRTLKGIERAIERDWVLHPRPVRRYSFELGDGEIIRSRDVQAPDTRPNVHPALRRPQTFNPQLFTCPRFETNSPMNYLRERIIRFNEGGVAADAYVYNGFEGVTFPTPRAQGVMNWNIILRPPIGSEDCVFSAQNIIDTQYDNKATSVYYREDAWPPNLPIADNTIAPFSQKYWHIVRVIGKNRVWCNGVSLTFYKQSHCQTIINPDHDEFGVMSEVQKLVNQDTFIRNAAGYKMGGILHAIKDFRDNVE